MELHIQSSKITGPEYQSVFIMIYKIAVVCRPIRYSVH